MATIYSPAPTSLRPTRRPRSLRRAAVVAGLVAGALLGNPAALAAPGPGNSVSDAQAEHDAAAAEVAAIGARVTEAQNTLERMSLEA